MRWGKCECLCMSTAYGSIWFSSLIAPSSIRLMRKGSLMSSECEETGQQVRTRTDTLTSSVVSLILNCNCSTSVRGGPSSTGSSAGGGGMVLVLIMSRM